MDGILIVVWLQKWIIAHLKPYLLPKWLESQRPRLTGCMESHQFRFFSHPHLSLSRRDHIFVSRLTIDRTNACFINTCPFRPLKSLLRKSVLANQLELEQWIITLHKDFKTSSSTHVLKTVEATWSALDQLLTQKAESAIFFATPRLFESGNKPDRLLARLAKGLAGPYVIPLLRDSTGTQHFESKIIS